MPNIATEPGQRFNKLTVLGIQIRGDLTPSKIATGKKGDRHVVVRCDCGKVVVYRVSNLGPNSMCLECGLDRGRHQEKPLGKSHHYLYSTWANMVQRCNDQNTDNYKYYGGRGIEVCPEWRDSQTFLNWIDANLGLRPEGWSIDRIDVHGNYEPGNVRWADKNLQRANQTHVEKCMAHKTCIQRNT